MRIVKEKTRADTVSLFTKGVNYRGESRSLLHVRNIVCLIHYLVLLRRWGGGIGVINHNVRVRKVVVKGGRGRGPDVDIKKVLHPRGIGNTQIDRKVTGDIDIHRAKGHIEIGKDNIVKVEVSVGSIRGGVKSDGVGDRHGGGGGA